jgi:hypothetical protein
MKTLRGIIPVIFGLLLSVPVISSACHIELTADKDRIKPGDVVSITVTSIKEHRNCELEDDEYYYELSNNATLLSQGSWTEIKRGIFENTYEIKIDNTGLFAFRVYRECNKKGISEAKLSYQVN